MIFCPKAIPSIITFIFSWLQWRSCIANAAFASSNIPPPPSLSLPVWSLACPLNHKNTTDAYPNIVESRTSMNIVTYAMPVNVAPPKLWAVSLYKSTLTKAAFVDSKVGILQLLSPDQSKLVPILGKRSGLEQGFSKRSACANLGVSWRRYRSCCFSSTTRSTEQELLLQSVDILPHCQSYIHLDLLYTVDVGDHDLAICQVFATGQWKSDKLVLLRSNESQPVPRDATSVLYSGQLRHEGIL